MFGKVLDKRPVCDFTMAASIDYIMIGHAVLRKRLT